MLLLCQEKDAARHPFVDEDGDLAPGDPWPFDEDAAGGGRCRVLRPGIGEILPVFVLDEYEGFTSKLFVDLSEAELEAYVRANVEVLEQVLAAFRPDAFITGHEVMGPFIAAEAGRATGRAYLAKLHGSGLEYAVKLQERYRRYASEGLAEARRVVGGSAYMVREAAAHIPGSWAEDATVVNPGCDVDLFKPLPRPPSSRPHIGFVGKLIASKGVHHLLACLGLLEGPPPKVTIVGYGGFEEGLRRLWEALRIGDEAAALTVARQAEGSPLEPLVRWLEAGGIDDRFRARISEVDLTFMGRLEHEPLAEVFPFFDVAVVPSVVPEAFGMVAAEAAACGVLPVVPAHSGIGEAGAALEKELGRPGLLTYDPREPIASLAQALSRILVLLPEDRDRLGAAAAGVARKLWSWDHVADRLVELAAGTTSA